MLFETMTFTTFLTEQNNFKQLQSNKVPLTDEERDQCLADKAIWHHGPGGKPTAAVWKAKDKNGTMTYVTNTHRAFNTASTLNGAIKRYHDFIKGTA